MTLRLEELLFLKKRTKLSDKNLLSLIELPRDFELTLQAVSKQKIHKSALRRDFAQFSLPFCIKYLFYKFVQEDWDIDLLSYLAGGIITFVPEVQKKQSFRPAGGRGDESGLYNLIISGMFRTELESCKLDFRKYCDASKKIYEKIGKQKLAQDAPKISELLNKFNLEKSL